MLTLSLLSCEFHSQTTIHIIIEAFTAHIKLPYTNNEHKKQDINQDRGRRW